MKAFLPLLFLLGSFVANAQLSGTITDSNGDPLPFASVYIKGTSLGTTSNIEGYYELELSPGEYQLVFQYVGFRQEVRQLTLGNASMTLDIQLEDEAIRLNEVVVKADAEDPAYAVIRKAIARRKYYRDLIERYACDVYIKGNIKMLDAPAAFMGVDIGNMGGSLDSNRQGIIYLSESQAKLYYQAPDKKKEVMLSTKVSGNDNGFGFNRASQMDFDLYENHAFLGRQIISPIATNALLYYRYRLIGTFYDDVGRLVNKIEVIPKRPEDPVYSGIINIVEELWNIQTVDLKLSSGNIKQPGLDTLFIKQVHVPVKTPDLWRIFSQTIRFKAGLFGFEMEGNFQAVFSKYDLEPDYERGFFNNETFKVTEGANDKDLEFWDTIRPIPLTQEESVDYVRKDSIQEIRTSKYYMDSIDAKNNRFKGWDLLFGYDYENSFEKESYQIGSPLTTIQYNTVQGWNADIGVRYSKDYGKYSTRRLRVNGNANYGFADHRLRATLGFTYQFNRTKYTRIGLEGGSQVAQFNPDNPITNTLNTLYTNIDRRNFMKLYEKAYGAVNFRHEIFNGGYLQTSLEYAERSPLLNRSDYSIWGEKSKAFSSNNPLFPNSYEPAFDPNKALIWTVALRLRYKQKYITYPERKFIQGSSLPSLWLYYQKGVEAFGSQVNFDHIAVRIEENYAPIGVIGYSEFNVEAGTFFNTKGLGFMDVKHFNGNQTFIGNPEKYMNSFMLLPYYEYSTDSMYVQAHFQHHFESFLLDKIPGIRNLGWSSVLGAKVLYTEAKKEYVELSFGLDKIGFGAFRLFRFDVVSAYSQANGWDWGFLVGLRLPGN